MNLIVEENKLVQYGGGLLKKVGNSISITNKILKISTKPYKILHIDDHKLILNGVKECILKNMPSTIIKHFYNGISAIDEVVFCFNNKEKVDLIITDLAHPQMNGIEFVQKLREIEKPFGNRIPVIVLSMHSNNNSVTKPIEDLVDKFLSKNDSCETILFSIKSLIENY